MKNLRHPIRAIREPFGTAGLIVACVALVAALGGTALAAAKLNGTQKKEVEKIAKKYAGKPGAVGPAGPAGAVGPVGLAGAAGKNGKNGEEGPRGSEGSPWTDGGTLPSGSTETGILAVTSLPEETGVFEFRIPISFPIPLANPLEDAAHCGESGEPACPVHVFEEGETAPTGCSGTLVGGKLIELEASPGNLCVYLAGTEGTLTAAQLVPIDLEGLSGGLTPGAGRTGTMLTTTGSPKGASAWGFWAVTAE